MGREESVFWVSSILEREGKKERGEPPFRFCGEREKRKKA